MSEQTMPDKLELIAKCIREGREVEVRYRDNPWKHGSASPDKTGDCTVLERMQYRAKPEKPRTATVGPNMRDLWESIELTPEVRQALEDAGLI